MKYFWKLTSRFWKIWLTKHPSYLGLVGDIWSYKYSHKYRCFRRRQMRNLLQPNGWLSSFKKWYSPSFANEVLCKYNEPFLCNGSETKVTSYSYFEILQCQNVSQCRSLYYCQTHKLLRPNGWLSSFKRKYCLLLSGEVFLKLNEPFLRNMTCNTSMLSGSWF